MSRSFSRFLGIALGGGRGKTTAVAELTIARDGSTADVVEVGLRGDHRPWTDDALIERLGMNDGQTVVAIDAPLTAPACGRCEQPVCPGIEACADPAVAWLRTEGRAMLSSVAEQTANGRTRLPTIPQARLAPWAHRATDLVMTYQRGLLPLTTLGHAHGAIAARAHHLRKRLRGHGFVLHESLIEVSPAATIAALIGERSARGYKRDADPWRTRAMILEQLPIAFAPSSRMARESVLQNDHGFDAVIAGFTASRWAIEGWKLPDGVFAADGWVYAPQSKL